MVQILTNLQNTQKSFVPLCLLRNKCQTNPICKKTINEQRTMNYELCSNEPNSTSPELACTEYHRSVEGLCKTNPILSTGLSINQFEQKMRNEPNLRKQRKMNNEQFSNEPNLKSAEIRVKSFNAMPYNNFHPFEHPKNEPNFKEKRTMSKLPILTTNNKYVPDISVYSCSFVVPYYGYWKNAKRTQFTADVLSWPPLRNFPANANCTHGRFAFVKRVDTPPCQNVLSQQRKRI